MWFGEVGSEKDLILGDRELDLRGVAAAQQSDSSCMEILSEAGEEAGTIAVV